MDNEAKLRPLYLAKILYEKTDEDHYLTTAQLMQILEDKYGIRSHRQTIKSEIELLRQAGLEIEEVKSTQNRYNVFGRKFDLPELKLLIDAVKSSKFITQAKSKELVSKLTSLTSEHIAESIKRNITCEGRIKPDNERSTSSLMPLTRQSTRIKRFHFNISTIMFVRRKAQTRWRAVYSDSVTLDLER